MNPARLAPGRRSCEVPWRSLKPPHLGQAQAGAGISVPRPGYEWCSACIPGAPNFRPYLPKRKLLDTTAEMLARMKSSSTLQNPLVLHSMGEVGRDKLILTFSCSDALARDSLSRLPLFSSLKHFYHTSLDFIFCAISFAQNGARTYDG